MGHPAALKGGMDLARLQNQSRRFVALDLPAVVAKTDAIDWAKSPDMLINMAYQPDTDKSWHLVTTNYAIVPLDPKDRTRGEEVMKLFNFALTTGRAIAAAENYAVLPSKIEGTVRAMWHKIAS